MLMVALEKSKQHAKRPGRTAQRTPQRPKKKEIPVIGSSCTWKSDELDHLKVIIERDVDVRTMIPERFFRFDHLEEYPECKSAVRIWLTAGKRELCELSERDLENEKLVNRIRNPSRSTFLSLYDIFQTQSDLRQQNISRKRQRSKQASQVSSSMDVSQSTQITFGDIFFHA